MSDEIKGGRYQLVATRFDQATSKEGEPFTFNRHVRGDVITLDAEEAHRLVTAGAVVKEGELERQAAEQARLAYEAALAALPDNVRAELLGAQQVDEDDDGDQPALVKPARTAPHHTWVAFAVSKGMDQASAEALTVQQLAAQFKDA